MMTEISDDKYIEINKKAFGIALKKLRKLAKINQELLARKSGLQRSYISILELGQQQPSLTTIIKLSNGLNLTLSKLMGSVELEIRFSVICMKNNIKTIKDRDDFNCKNITDTYIKKTMKEAKGMDVNEIPKDLLEAKHIQIKLKRLLKELKN